MLATIRVVVYDNVNPANLMFVKMIERALILGENHSFR